MKRTTRLLAGALTTVALSAGMTVATATTANAVILDALNGSDWAAYPPRSNPIAYPGMFIDFAGDLGYATNTCTMGVVGTDSAGRKIGITAGHCSHPESWDVGTTASNGKPFKYDGPARGTVHAGNDYPVFDRNAAKWADQEAKAGRPKPVVNPIGWVRWVDDDTCDQGDKYPAFPFDKACTVGVDTDPDSKTDYMVIELATNVQLDGQIYDKAGNPVMSTDGSGNPFKVNSIYTESGNLALPPVGSQVEHFGAMSARSPAAVGFLAADWAKAPNSGPVQKHDSPVTGLFRADVPQQGGDSGGPVVARGTGQWAGIIFAESGEGFLRNQRPYIFTSAKNILNNLNGLGIVGSGFTPITN